MRSRKIAFVLCFSIILSFLVPSFPAYADSSGFRFITTESISDYGWGESVSGANIDLSLYASHLYLCSNSDIDNYVLPQLESLPISLDDYYYMVTLYNERVTVYCINKSSYNFEDVLCIAVSSASNSNPVRIGFDICFKIDESTIANVRPNVVYYTYNLSSNTWDSPLQGNTQSGYSNSGGYYWYYAGGSLGYKLCMCNLPLYYDSEMIAINAAFSSPAEQNPYYPTTGAGLRPLLAYIQNGDKFDNFNPDTLPYYNGSSIISPGQSLDDIPENKQIAFSSIDLLQVYDRGSGAQTDARLDWTMDDQSFDFSQYPIGWRMNYMLHISFQISESSDYRVFKPTTNKLFGDVYIPYDYPVNGDFTFSEILLGHSTFQLKDALQVEGAEFYGSEGAVGALALFAYAASQNTSFAFEAMSFTTGALEGFLQAAGLQFPTDVAYDISLFAQNNFTNSKEGYAYVLNQLQFDVTARCYNPSAGLKSRLGEASVNMISGQHSGTAPGAVIKDQNDNDVQLPSYNNTGDDYLSLSYDSSGNPVYVVNNVTLPSGAGGSNSSVSSGGNAYVSLSIPEKIEIVQDTLKQFAELMSQPADSVQGTFWGFFGLFKENPIADIYGDYFGFLPDDFKDYVLALCGISFGVICFSAIRRRLT